MLHNETLLEYMHDYVFKWYQQADTKAQVVLGFTGIFLSILVGAFVSGFVKYYAEQTTWLKEFPQELFWIAVACHLGAVIFSAIALWSRGVFRVKKSGVVFFGHIANHSDANEFRKAVCSDVTQEDYQNELAINIYHLARNTRIKHRFVDISVVSSGLALLTTVWLLAVLLLKAL